MKMDYKEITVDGMTWKCRPCLMHGNIQAMEVESLEGKKHQIPMVSIDGDHMLETMIRIREKFCDKHFDEDTFCEYLLDMGYEYDPHNFVYYGYSLRDYGIERKELTHEVSIYNGVVSITYGDDVKDMTSFSFKAENREQYSYKRIAMLMSNAMYIFEKFIVLGNMAVEMGRYVPAA